MSSNTIAVIKGSSCNDASAYKTDTFISPAGGR